MVAGAASVHPEVVGLPKNVMAGSTHGARPSPRRLSLLPPCGTGPFHGSRSRVTENSGMHGGSRCPDILADMIEAKTRVRTMRKRDVLEALSELTKAERQEVRLRLARLDGEEWTAAVDPLTDAEKALLDARLAAYERDPDVGHSWQDVEARIRARLGA